MAVYPSLARFLSEELEIPSAAHLRVALSGGSDSTALLALLVTYRARRRPDLRLSAGHVHHGLRGAAADRDENFCRRLAAELGVEIEIARVDSLGRARLAQLSIETAARQLRLERFAAWARESKLFAVLTAHTAGDQVETVLAQILRGSSLTGLRGMPVRRELDGAPGAWLVRPLLGIERAALTTWRETTGLAACDDSTNYDRAHRRNRLRHELLPLLREHYNPQIDRALLGLAHDAHQLAVYRERRLAPARQLVQSGREFATLQYDSVPNELREPALLAALLDTLWQRATGAVTTLSRDHHSRFLQFLARSGSGKQAALPGAWRLERTAGWIYLFRPVETAPAHAEEFSVAEASHGELAWIPARWTVSGKDCEAAPSACETHCLEFELPLTPSTATLRTARASDTFGIANGHVRVFDVLRDAGVPGSLRARFPVLEMGGRLVWLPGIRRAAYRDSLGAQPDVSGIMAAGQKPDADRPHRLLRLELDPSASLLAFLIGRHRRDDAAMP
ncbi:MAG: tRNA lysidine(34) synthetase TilS [Planctomycetota bacterium]